VKSRDANAGGEVTRPSKPLRAQGATASSLRSERRTIRFSSSGWKKSKKLNRPARREARREARPPPSALKVLVRPPSLRSGRRLRRALLDRIVHRSLDAPLLDRCGARRSVRASRCPSSPFDRALAPMFEAELLSEHASARTHELEELITTMRRRERVVLSDAWQRHGHGQR
jgi:hypothetical protein